MPILQKQGLVTNQVTHQIAEVELRTFTVISIDRYLLISGHRSKALKPLERSTDFFQIQ